VGHRAGLDVVVKRKIPIPCWNLNPYYTTELSWLQKNYLNLLFLKMIKEDSAYAIIQ
jgi:hypothetical protein